MTSVTNNCGAVGGVCWLKHSGSAGSGKRSVSRRRRHPVRVSLGPLFKQPLKNVLKTVTRFLAAIQFFPRFFGYANVFVSITGHGGSKDTLDNKKLPALTLLTTFTLVTKETYFREGVE
jgi:hypothetical protein